jgi:LysR family glycine cleavage system transcriptional activator
VIDAAIGGMGVALAKRCWIRRDLAEGRLVQLFPELTLPVEFSYFFVYPQDRADDTRIQAFMRWVKEEYAADPMA